MQHRTEDTKVWAYSNTGTKAHAFLRIVNGTMYAACRGNIIRNADATTMTAQDVSGTLCTRCATLLASYLDRVAASMEPATEADDLGYVHVEAEPVEETSDYELPASLVDAVYDVVYEGIVIPEGVELVEIRSERRVIVRASALGHRQLSRRLVHEVVGAVATQSASGYRAWAGKL